MRLSAVGLAVTFAILWGGTILLVALANAIWPQYGQAFLDIAASIYPGYTASGTFGDLVTGTLYGALDGAIFGLLIALIYNALTKPKNRRHA